MCEDGYMDVGDRLGVVLWCQVTCDNKYKGG
jgi:hypothetical protein